MVVLDSSSFKTNRKSGHLTTSIDADRPKRLGGRVMADHVGGEIRSEQWVVFDF